MEGHTSIVTTDLPLAVFVYGTLKYGEINHVLLAPYVRSIERASVRGVLYDAGDFPALVEGEKDVHGQIIRVAAHTLPHLLAVLDRLEGYDPEDEEHSLYRRRVIDVALDGGAIEPAFAYFYNSAHPTMPPPAMMIRLESGEWSGEADPSQPSGDTELDRYREWVRTFRHRSDET